MNSTQSKANLNEQRGKLEQKFAVLTDNDQMFAEGKKKEILGKKQLRFARSKEELQRILAGF